jgi:hypothetical protein
MKHYKVPEDTLIELLEACFTLEALECAGTDVWDWFSTKLVDYLKDAKHNYDLSEEEKADFDFKLMAEKELENGEFEEV